MTSRPRRARASWPAIAFAAVSIAFPLLAQKAQSAGEFYLSYVAAAEKMTSLKDLAPFVPKDQAAMMSRMPKEMDKEMLAEVRKELVTGVKILKESPSKDGALLEMEGTRKATGKKVTGWANITREAGAWKLEKDDWSGVPPPAPPKIPATVEEPGKAVGEFTVNGQTAKLLYAYATAGPDTFDKTKTAYHVILSDIPWNPKDYNQMDRVKAGTLHYIDVTIGSDRGINGTMLHHRGFKSETMSSAGAGHIFEPEKIGPDVIAGRAYLEAPKNPMGETFYYAATFRAPISK